MESVLNLVLIADSESTQKQMPNRTGVIDLGAFCVELWPKQVSYRISVPMSYISCSRLIKVKISLKVSSYPKHRNSNKSKLCKQNEKMASLDSRLSFSKKFTLLTNSKIEIDINGFEVFC